MELTAPVLNTENVNILPWDAHQKYFLMKMHDIRCHYFGRRLQVLKEFPWGRDYLQLCRDKFQNWDSGYIAASFSLTGGEHPLLALFFYRIY